MQPNLFIELMHGCISTKVINNKTKNSLSAIIQIHYEKPTFLVLRFHSDLDLCL